LAHRLVCSSARLLFNLSAEGSTLHDACRRRMRIPPPSTGRTEYDADEADETREPNHLLVGSSARRFGLLHSSTNGGNPCNFFFHLFLFLIERLVQRRLVSSSTRRLIGLVGSSASSACRLIGSSAHKEVCLRQSTLMY
jgi:hypothetical protein